MARITSQKRNSKRYAVVEHVNAPLYTLSEQSIGETKVFRGITLGIPDEERWYSVELKQDEARRLYNFLDKVFNPPT